jgi:uncharacterized protein YkwD
MKHYLDRLIPAFGLLAGLVACGCGSTEFAETKSQANPLDAEESDLVLQLNLFRRDNAGITTPVIVCTALNVSASEHADDMRDKNYLSDMAPDGSIPRTRACAAGYKPACAPNAPMAEVVAQGFVLAKSTFPQWTMDANTKPLLLNPGLTVVGVGRSLGDSTMWSMEMSSVDDPACH